jgi:hypothetical protein
VLAQGPRERLREEPRTPAVHVDIVLHQLRDRQILAPNALGKRGEGYTSLAGAAPQLVRQPLEVEDVAVLAVEIRAEPRVERVAVQPLDEEARRLRRRRDER